MSVLLEALKRAALEKKERTAPVAEDSTSAQTQSAQTRTDTDSPTEDVPLQTDVEDNFLDMSDEIEIEDLEAEVQAESESERDGNKDAEHLLDTFDDEIATTDPNEAGSEVEADSEPELDFEHFDIEQARRDQEQVLEAVRQAELKKEEDRLERELRHAEELLAEQQRENEAEARRIEELENRKREEKAAKDKVLLEEQARERAESATALTTLVYQGHAINRRMKRRSRFLYAMLVLTALGGVGAYYFYLLGNNNLRLLLPGGSASLIPVVEGKASESHGSVEPSAYREPSAYKEPSAGIDRELSADVEPSAGAGSTAGTEPSADVEVLAGAEPSAYMEPSAGIEPSAYMEPSAGIEPSAYREPSTSAAALADNTPSSNNEQRVMTTVNKAINTLSQAGSRKIPGSGLFSVEERADHPPSANVIIEQLAGTPPPRESSSGSDIDNTRVAVDLAAQEPQRVHIFHKSVPTKIGGVLKQAYGAYQANNLDEAEALYDEALRLDPRNRDALLGAAAIASARGNHQDALKLYQLRLQEDPADSYARAGLLALSSHSTIDPGEIDALLQTTPEAAYLHFLKGAVFASRKDWRQAQAAFFEAHHWEGNNPDYAFNLAVSLDHLDQTSSAIKFYKQALELALTQNAGFSIASARKRLGELEQAND